MAGMRIAWNCLMAVACLFTAGAIFIGADHLYSIAGGFFCIAYACTCLEEVLDG